MRAALIALILLSGIAACKTESGGEIAKKPEAPASLEATPGNGSVTLEWTPVSNATQYNLYWSNDENSVKTSGTVIENISLPFTHTPVDNDETYYYVVTAAGPGGESDISNTANATPLAPPSKPELSSPAPTANEFTLIWTETANETYTLLISTEPRIGNADVQFQTIEDVTTPYSNSELLPGIRYYFTLYATNNVGSSELSSEISRMLAPQALIATGTDHTCAIKDDLSLWCWGYNNNGQLGNGTVISEPGPIQVASGTSWNHIAAGGSNTCGVQDTGTLWCWGINLSGQIGDGTIGDSERKLEPVKITTSEAWSSVAVGEYHSCGLSISGTLLCWGYNGYGQLGTGNSTQSSQPSPVLNSDLPWRAVSAGEHHTCAIKSNDSLWCWGNGSFGRLGDGNANTRNIPAIVSGTWRKVTTGNEHTCAISKADNSLHCWGNNKFGQLGNGVSGSGEVATSPVSIDDAESWLDITAGNNFSCGIKTNNTLWCWGRNNYGHFGEADAGSADVVDSPVQIGTGSQWRSVHVGGMSDHICADQLDGSTRCWGSNVYQQLGNGNTSLVETNPYALTPAPANTDTNWVKLSAGWSHTCAIRDDTSLWCWGYNPNGTVGNNRQSHQKAPVRIGTNSGWLQVSAGSEHTCGIQDTGTLWCWGLNGIDSMLGQGSATPANVLSPAQLGIDEDWAEVTAGYTHSCATKTDGVVYCWGNGFARRLAQGASDTADKDTPTPILSTNTPSLTDNWLSVEAGDAHTCAIKKTDEIVENLYGSLWCWGSNSFGATGQGDGVTGNSFRPTQSGSETDWLTIASGQHHSCGIRAAIDAMSVPTNELYCWGNDVNGQLADNDASNTSTTIPTLIATDATNPTNTTNWRSVSSFLSHTCGVKKDNTLWCWGRNEYGTLGNGIDPANIEEIPTPLPVQIGSTEWSVVVPGGDHTCAIKTDNTLWCWGSNYYGDLGNDLAWSPEPVNITLE